MTDYSNVFLDTSPFIYLLEKNPEYYENVKQFFTKCYENSNNLFTSVVSIEEYCIIPYRDNKQNLIDDFNRFLKDMDINVVDIDSQIADRAARIRAEYRCFKGMDCLQLATACENGCELFITNDRQLKQFTQLSVKLVKELAE